MHKLQAILMTKKNLTLTTLPVKRRQKLDTQLAQLQSEYADFRTVILHDLLLDEPLVSALEANFTALAESSPTGLIELITPAPPKNPLPEPKVTFVSTSKATSQATVSKPALDTLIARADQTWLSPFTSAKWNDHLHSTVFPTFHGEAALDNKTVVQFTVAMADLFFRRLGVPLDHAVRTFRSCLPESSLSKIWYSTYLANNPDISFPEFIAAFVHKFLTDDDICRLHQQFDTFQQNQLSISDFAARHQRLYLQVNPTASEIAMVLDWKLRLNPRCQALFSKYLERLRRENMTPSYDHALTHLNRKLRDLDSNSGTLFFTAPAPTYTPTDQGAYAPCDRGCRYRRHLPGNTCPALMDDRVCHSCRQPGHFSGSKMCPSPRTQDRSSVFKRISPNADGSLPHSIKRVRFSDTTHSN